MEIKFLLPNGSLYDSPYEFQTSIYKRQLSYYLRLKCLEFHKPFVEVIEEARKKYSLDALKLRTEVLEPVIKLNSNDYWNGIHERLSKSSAPSYTDVYFETEKILDILSLPSNIRHLLLKYHTITEILLFETVYFHTNDQTIFVDSVNDDWFGNVVKLTLTEFKTKTSLITFIRKHYESIIKPEFEKTKLFRKLENFSMSPESLKILNLKHHYDMSYKQIANEFNKTRKFNEYDATSIRKAHQRAMDRILRKKKA
jgi:hypothetical protein